MLFLTLPAFRIIKKNYPQNISGVYFNDTGKIRLKVCLAILPGVSK